MRRLRVLHAIHDFLPRHAAGSEIYACELARAQSKQHDVFVAAAEYDPATPHGTLRWRVHDGLAVIEVVNNWEFESLEESYSSSRLNQQLRHVLDATMPDVLHVHNLLNLSVDLPRIARERGIRSVATLHDYTLVCPSGGQRVHVSESHVCARIDVERCARCFNESAWQAQMAAGRLTKAGLGRAVTGAAAVLHARAAGLAAGLSSRLNGVTVTPEDVARRLAYVRHVFNTVDQFVAPSQALADEFVALGLPRDRLVVSDYGFAPSPRPARVERANGVLRIGFVGTLVWHKGAHVLLEAVRGLRGSYEVLVFGDTRVFPQYSSSLKALAGGLPVRFMGCFEREALFTTYAQLDALVVPSLWPENSPLVIHEAFMHGVPVVAARMGGIPGLVTDDRSGLLYDAFSPERLRASLQRLIDEPDLRERLAAGAPHVKTIEQDAREWDERYRAVLEDRRPSVL